MARRARSGSPSPTSSFSWRGTICHESPNRSLSHPHRPGSPPSAVSEPHSRSTSAWSSHSMTNETWRHSERGVPPGDRYWMDHGGSSGGGRAQQRTNPRRLAQRRRGRNCLPLFGARPAHHRQRDPSSVTHAASRDLGSTGDRPDPGKCVRRRSGLRGTLSADAEVQIHSPRYGTAVAIGTCEISLKRPSSGGRRPLEPRHAYRPFRRRYWSNRSCDRPPIPLATEVFLMDRRGRTLARRRRAGSADP